MAHTIASDVDRLPWLTDDKAPRKTGGRWWIAALSLIALIAVAAVSFWFGMTQTQAPAGVEPAQSQPEATIPLPYAAPQEPLIEDVELAPMPQVEPAPVQPPVVIRQQEEVRPAIASAPPQRKAVKRSAPSRSAQAKKTAAASKPDSDRKSLEFSNPWESAGASGRMVRVGTYANLDQGKQAWSRLARVFPGMKKLPAVVTDIPSQRNGRVYYRLQIGTTSQAHSEVLCQRMRAIGQSCVIVDLAGARKGIWDERQPVGL